MRRTAIAIMLSILAGAGSTGPAAARYATVYAQPVSGADAQYHNILAGDDGTFEQWGTAPSWADEEQVGFVMPAGGPWLVWLLKAWVSGTSPHTVIIRQPCDTMWSPPCGVVDRSISFTPGYAGPPDRWVTIDLLPLGLMLGGGQEVFIGVTLDGTDDGIGLDTTDAAGPSWGLFNGFWEDDATSWGARAGIRLVVTDTSFDHDNATWGAIKALFGDAGPVGTLPPARGRP